MESTQTAQALPVEEPVLAAAPPTPILVADTPDAPTSGTTSDSPNDHGLTALIGALRAREFALIDPTVLYESAVEIEDAIRSWFGDLHLEDIRPGGAVAGARALLGRFDLSVLTSAMSRTAAARPHRGTRPHASASASEATYPSRVRTVRITPAVPDRSAMPRVPRAPNRLGRVRWRRVVTRGLAVGVLAAVLTSLPPEQIANVATEVRPVIANVANEMGPAIANIANEVGPAIGNVANEVRSAIGETLAAAQPAPTLARASFELPPLGAYGATFESQAPYPTARPNGTVEWVVALRNTGSVGWYRGIHGAQASLALADGTVAAVQTTEYVGPGQVGWFVVRFPARSEPGTYEVALLPRIDGRGQLPDLGIYATVTVSTNP
jgi:hypothetical protein